LKGFTPRRESWPSVWRFECLAHTERICALGRSALFRTAVRRDRRLRGSRSGVATAVRWCRQWRETSNYCSKPRGNPGCGSKLDAHASCVLHLVDEVCDISLKEIGERLSHEHGVSTSLATLSRFFRRRSRIATT
jgi:hypothetical protein